MEIRPVTVLYDSRGGWTFSVVINGRAFTSCDIFDSTSIARQAMREFISLIRKETRGNIDWGEDGNPENPELPCVGLYRGKYVDIMKSPHGRGWQCLYGGVLVGNHLPTRERAIQCMEEYLDRNP